MAISFIDLDALTLHLGVTLEEDKAVFAIDSACDILRKSAGQDFDFTEDDEVTLDSKGSDYILLPEVPVHSIDSVTYLSRASSSSITETALVADFDYFLDTEMGSIVTGYPANRFLTGRHLYRVVYTHGYLEQEDEAYPGVPSYPQTLKMLALQLAARIYDQGLVLQETVGSYVAIYSAREAIVLTDREKSILERAVGIGRRR